MNIAIVDDLQMDRQILQGFISRYCLENRICFSSREFESGEALLTVFEQKKFDVIFLDIYMNGIDGIETAQRIRKIDDSCLLIFTTTSRQHAVKSYRVRAFDYIVKPYDYAQFEEVMGLLKNALMKWANYIEVKEGRTTIKILLRDIIYTDYNNHYIQIHTKERMIKTYMNFSSFSQMLEPYKNFMCCYRNCMINMDQVGSIDARDFVMKNGERVPIAKLKRTEIRQQFADYMFHKLDKGI